MHYFFSGTKQGVWLVLLQVLQDTMANYINVQLQKANWHYGVGASTTKWQWCQLSPHLHNFLSLQWDGEDTVAMTAATTATDVSVSAITACVIQNQYICSAKNNKANVVSKTKPSLSSIGDPATLSNKHKVKMLWSAAAGGGSGVVASSKLNKQREDYVDGGLMQSWSAHFGSASQTIDYMGTELTRGETIQAIAVDDWLLAAGFRFPWKKESSINHWMERQTTVLECFCLKKLLQMMINNRYCSPFQHVYSDQEQ